MPLFYVSRSYCSWLFQRISLTILKRSCVLSHLLFHYTNLEYILTYANRELYHTCMISSLRIMLEMYLSSKWHIFLVVLEQICVVHSVHHGAMLAEYSVSGTTYAPEGFIFDNRGMKVMACLVFNSHNV